VVEDADSTPAPNTDADADDLFDPIVPGGDTGGNTTSNTTVTAGPYAPQVCSTDGVREDVRCGNIFDQDECTATTYRSVRAACPVMCGVCTAAAPAAESPPCEMDYSKYPKEHVSCGDVFDRDECESTVHSIVRDSCPIMCALHKGLCPDQVPRAGTPVPIATVTAGSTATESGDSDDSATVVVVLVVLILGFGICACLVCVFMQADTATSLPGAERIKKKVRRAVRKCCGGESDVDADAVTDVTPLPHSYENPAYATPGGETTTATRGGYLDVGAADTGSTDTAHNTDAAKEAVKEIKKPATAKQQTILQKIALIKTTHPGNLACKHFSNEYFYSLSDQDRHALLLCVKTGYENADSDMGCYAMQPTDYDRFRPFFSLVLAEYHSVSATAQHTTNWDLAGVVGLPTGGRLDLAALGLPELSMRVRVGRNLKNFPLPGAMTKDDRIALETKMCAAFEVLKADPKYGGRYNSLTKGHPDFVDEGQYNDLVKQHIMFKDMAVDTYLASAGIASDWPFGRGCYVSDDKQFIIWVGEEDHLRIMCMKKGALLNEVVERLKEALDVVTGIEGVEFATSEAYGHVTSCPTNLGTGMRASVHIPIPHLTADGTDKKAKAICKPLGLSVRGTGGEHTPIGADGTCDISPSARFCITEAEIVAALYSGLKLLKEAEDGALANEFLFHDDAAPRPNFAVPAGESNGVYEAIVDDLPHGNDSTYGGTLNKVVDDERVKMDLFRALNKNDGDAVVDAGELEAAMTNPEFLAVIEKHGIDLKPTSNSKSDAARLMGTLDRSGDGSVGMNEFLQGMTKLAKKAIEVPPAAATAETFDGFDGLDI